MKSDEPALKSVSIQYQITTKSSYPVTSSNGVNLIQSFYLGPLIDNCVNEEQLLYYVPPLTSSLPNLQNVSGRCEAAGALFFSSYSTEVAACFSTSYSAGSLLCLYCCGHCGRGGGDVTRIVRVSREWQPCSRFKCCRAPGMGAHAQSVFPCRAGQPVLLLDD